LASVLFQERIRITQTPWKADPIDEKDFWSKMRGELLRAQKEGKYNDPTYKILDDEILNKIINRYAYEIFGHFEPKVFQFATGFLPWLYSTLLNSRMSDKVKSFFSRKKPLNQKFKITGDIDILHHLSKEGTLIVVPTHFSNLDSPTIGFAIERCGLPAVIYGAGLNLFESQPFKYLMSNLGAYKLDRRKKNELYLDILKTYSKVAIKRGTHSLFFPGGTRSRSGALESKLKLGLLSTAIEAQQLNLENKGKKIFIVPAVINYNFVLEASSLVTQHLREMGKEKFVVDNFEYSSTYKIVRFLKQFFKSDSDLTISFGAPMDVIGNLVNEKGESINHLGNNVDIKDYFITDNKVEFDTQRNFEYTKLLGDKIVNSYFKYNTILSTHIVPFVVFKMLEKKYSKLDLFGLLRLPMEDTQIEYSELVITMEKVRTKILEMNAKGNVLISKELELPIVELIKHGLNNVGIFHSKKVIFSDSYGHLNSEDLKLLYFYHNRLLGYKLEQYI
jgi:glycerol-3-phosphate O-acyltransferase